MEKVNQDIKDFVYYMTHSKSLTRAQQARRDYLLVRDMSVKKTDIFPLNFGEEEQPNKRICEYHEPQKIFKFLHKFTINNTALKYTTHFWDKNPNDDKYAYDNFDDFKSKYKEDIEQGENNLDSIYPLCKHLWEIVKNFLMQDDPKYSWSEYKIKMGYNKYVKEWMNANPGIQPASMPISAFPKELQPEGLINGKVLSYFSDVINIFKHCIEFRGNDLYLSVLKNFKSSDHILDKKDLETLKGCAIYTDTWLVKEALGIIAGNVIQRSMYPELKISCRSLTIGENGVTQLRVLQVNSFSNRDINDAKIKASSNEGDFSRIKDKLKNLCDFSVESKFRIGNDFRHCRINYLSSDENTEDIVYLDNEECQGFTYILTFYTA